MSVVGISIRDRVQIKLGSFHCGGFEMIILNAATPVCMGFGHRRILDLRRNAARLLFAATTVVVVQSCGSIQSTRNPISSNQRAEQVAKALEGVGSMRFSGLLLNPADGEIRVSGSVGLARRSFRIIAAHETSQGAERVEELWTGGKLYRLDPGLIRSIGLDSQRPWLSLGEVAASDSLLSQAIPVPNLIYMLRDGSLRLDPERGSAKANNGQVTYSFSWSDLTTSTAGVGRATLSFTGRSLPRSLTYEGPESRVKIDLQVESPPRSVDPPPANVTQRFAEQIDSDAELNCWWQNDC